MKKILTLCIVFTGLCHASKAQDWCVPTVNAALSFGSGINNVTLNGSPAIDRDSPAGTEAYINTGLSSSLARGNTYALSVGKSIGTYCVQLNVKVFIDFNLDHDFYDAGELVGTADNAIGGVSNFPFTVPMTATLGTSRMRVCEKMTLACGHSPIDPCGPDAVDNAIGGWHGEIEDYTIELVAQAGVAEHDALSAANFTVIDRMLWLSTTTPLNAAAHVTISDLAGRTLTDMALDLRGAGRIAIGELPRGLFLARVTVGDGEHTQRVYAE